MDIENKNPHSYRQDAKKATHLYVGAVDGCALGPSLCAGVGSSDGVLVGSPDGLKSSNIKKKERRFYNQHEMNELMMSFK